MQIKCTSCGASQELTNDQNCDYCGSIIELDKGRENYQSFSSGEVGNLMMMAETAIEATNWEEALQYFNKALEKEITNSDAWLGKGIAMVYTSKIGDIKTTEAIAYWKNAIKHASNSDAMSKRVAKEINNVVNKFYPVIENHYIEFHNLENSYQELVSRFVQLETAQDYATNLDRNNFEYHETGYLLCARVLELPKKYASNAMTGAIIDTFASGNNKFKQRDASQNYRNANNRSKEILFAAKTIFILQDKYISSIKSISPTYNTVSSREYFEKDLAREERDHKNSNDLSEMWRALFSLQFVKAMKLAWSPFFRNTGVKK